MDAVVLHELYKIYREGEIETVALRGAQLQVESGDFVAITGRSGAGKSTLLSLIGGLAIPSAGRVVVGGTDIARLNERERALYRRSKIGIVYQADNLVPFLTALENVALPMQLAGRKRACAARRRTAGRGGPGAALAAPAGAAVGGRTPACGHRTGTGKRAGVIVGG